MGSADVSNLSGRGRHHNSSRKQCTGSIWHTVYEHNSRQGGEERALYDPFLSFGCSAARASERQLQPSWSATQAVLLSRCPFITLLCGSFSSAIVRPLTVTKNAAALAPEIDECRRPRPRGTRYKGVYEIPGTVRHWQQRRCRLEENAGTRGR